MTKRKYTKLGKTKELQNITLKTKDRVTRTSIKSGGELMSCGRVIKQFLLHYFNGFFSFLYSFPGRQTTQGSTVIRTWSTAGQNGIRTTLFSCSKSLSKSSSSSTSTSRSWWIFWWRRLWISQLIDERNYSYVKHWSTIV